MANFFLHSDVMYGSFKDTAQHEKNLLKFLQALIKIRVVVGVEIMVVSDKVVQGGSLANFSLRSEVEQRVAASGKLFSDVKKATWIFSNLYIHACGCQSKKF